MHANREKISVVIPVYNSSRYICETIDSVNDSCRDHEVEIILVDDMSGDINIIKEMVSEYSNVRLIEKNKKSNAAHSRNIGFEKSTYDKVFFLDSDDHFTYDYVQHRLKLMNETSCGVFFGGYTVVINRKKRIQYNKVYGSGDIRDYLFLENGDFRTSTVSINKLYHKGTLFDSEMRKHQDWGLGIRCYDAKESIYYDNQTHVMINVGRGDQMSASMNIEASDYFINSYIVNDKHLVKFVEIHMVPAICNKDLSALKFFFNCMKKTQVTGKRKVAFFIYKILSQKGILHFSSPMLSGMKLVKNLLK